MPSAPQVLTDDEQVVLDAYRAFRAAAAASASAEASLVTTRKTRDQRLVALEAARNNLSRFVK